MYYMSYWVHQSLLMDVTFNKYLLMNRMEDKSDTDSDTDPNGRFYLEAVTSPLSPLSLPNSFLPLF